MSDGVVTGAWTRDGVTTEYKNDYNRGIYPQRCTFRSKDLEDQLKRAYRARGNDPRVVMAFLNGDYTSDGAQDTWVSSFKTGKGDCDSKAIAALNLAYTYFWEQERTWIPMLAMGEAWLAGDDRQRKRTPHAFPVFVRADLKAAGELKGGGPDSRVLDYIKIGEPTYHWDSFESGGPGSGHIISVEWLLYPNPHGDKGTSAIKVHASNDMGRGIKKGHENVPLHNAIFRAVAPRMDVILQRMEEYSPDFEVVVEQISTNGKHMPVLKRYASKSVGVH